MLQRQVGAEVVKVTKRGDADVGTDAGERRRRLRCVEEPTRGAVLAEPSREVEARAGRHGVAPAVQHPRQRLIATDSGSFFKESKVVAAVGMRVTVKEPILLAVVPIGGSSRGVRSSGSDRGRTVAGCSVEDASIGERSTGGGRNCGSGRFEWEESRREL